MIQQRIGNYRIVRELGRGGMGVVYLAEHSLIGQRVAVKMILPEFSGNPHRMQRFFNEARAISQMRHPGFVNLFDYGQHESGAAYIIMDYLEGESVGARLHRERCLAVGLTVEVARQVTRALAAAHGRDIVHRDLKPDNIFLLPAPDSPSGIAVKVLDFGVAKLAGMSADGIAITHTGDVVGTPSYMSPEQSRGSKEVDHRTDIYALGGVMFHMVTGRLPFQYETYADMVAGHLHDPVPALADEPALDGVVRRCLAKRPEERYQSMTELGEALAEVARALGPCGPYDVPVAPERESDLPPPGVARSETFSLPGRADIPASDRRPPGVEGAGFVVRASDLPSAELAEFERGATGVPAPGPNGAATTPAPLRTWRVRSLLGIAGASLAVGTGVVTLVRATSSAMAHIAGGEFEMGSLPVEVRAASTWCAELAGAPCPPDRHDREQPVRHVVLSAYSMDRHEITNREFAEWLESIHGLPSVHVTRFDDGRELIYDGDTLLADLYPSYAARGISYHDGHFAARDGYGRKPVVNVTWDGALRYCRGHGQRLPTEAEWEFAARGTGRHQFPWGDENPRCDGVIFGRSQGQICAAHDLGPHDVAQSPQDRTSSGISDLGGNVAEWVMDRFEPHYPACTGACRDPVVEGSPAAGVADERVYRGGSWGLTADACRAAGRSRRRHDQPQGDLGFRCARQESR